MRAERLGSYSMEATLPGTPTLSRLKSTMRYIRLLPPPLCLVVILPLLFLPALPFRGRSRDFSGFFLVISSKEGRAASLVPGVFGLGILRGMAKHPR